MELFVFDIDGTLVESFGEIHPPVIEAVNALLRRGDAVAIASGRCFSGVKRYLSDLIPSPRKFALASNGAVVLKEDGTVLARSPMRYSDYLYLVGKYGGWMTVPYFYKDSWLGTKKVKAKIVKREVDYNRMDGVIDLKKVSMEKTDEVDKTLICAYPKHSLRIERNIESQDWERYNICRSSDIFLEFMAKGVDKSTGIGELVNYLGISPSSVHAFGDSMNDLQMVKEFDGTAMGNALPPVKEAAERITLSVHDDGIAYALKTWFGVKV